MKTEELKSLVKRFQHSLSYYKDNKKHYNEHSCRIEYIEPMLNLLGWDVSNKKGLPPQYREVIAENYSSDTDRPDYSMTLKGVTKFFVEVKKPAIDISSASEAAFQARKYGWNANHKITVLTNFEYLIIYDTTYCPQITDYNSVARFRIYHFSEYESKFDEISQLISRESIYEGRFDKYCNENVVCESAHKQQVDELFLEQINQWRIALSNSLLNRDHKYRNIEKLNDVVQEFINQIVFLRICEDRNLPLYHKLSDTIGNISSMKSKLEELFRAADKRYNSGIFDGENIIFDLNNDVIVGIIESLYYPQSPFLFNIIEPNLLGRIYEIFLTEQLTFAVNGQVELKKKKECLNRSVVTTPAEIVKYMVSKTLGNLCNGKTPDELLTLRIADIACGSGIFLEAVFDFLVQYCVNWYDENKPEELIEISGGRKKLPLNLKKQILQSCIYGVDIDIHAVEVAQFSLIIKLIEDETTPSVEETTPILPDLQNNIVHGNSLIGLNELQNKTLLDNELLEIVPFDWKNINNGDNFTAIIGNPPYVKTEDMHNLLPQSEFELYKKHYQTAYKQFDKYFLFVERAIQKVAEEGYVCFIIPNKFFKIGAGEKLRKLIAAKGYLISLDDFGDSQLFFDKTIYSSILFLQKKNNLAFSYTKVDSLAALWSGEDCNSVLMKNVNLNELPWRLTTDFDFMQLLTKIDSIAIPITEHADIFNGIQTSAERPVPVYWFSRDQIIEESNEKYNIKKDGQIYSIEKEILKPYFKPAKKTEKGLNSYSYIQTDKWIIFPYDNYGKLFDIHTMEIKFPGAYNYLKAYYDRLVPKQVSPNGIRDVPNSTAETWYQYGRTQALTSFINTPKLIVGVLSKEPMYAFDDKDILIASGGTAGYCAITQKPESPYSLEYLQAWLNNPHTEKILRIIGSDFENGFIARGTYVLQTLPFVPIDFSIPEQKSLHDRIVKETQRIYEINALLGKKPEKRVVTVLTREKEQLIELINGKIDMVYRLEF